MDEVSDVLAGVAAMSLVLSGRDAHHARPISQVMDRGSNRGSGADPLRTGAGAAPAEINELDSGRTSGLGHSDLPVIRQPANSQVSSDRASRTVGVPSG